MTAKFNTPLDDSQWIAIVSQMPQQIRGRIRTKEADYRAFVNAVLWVVGNDTCWKTVPGEGWRAIYVRFIRWVDQGLWTGVEHAIQSDAALVHALRQRVAVYSNKKLRRRRQNGGVAPLGDRLAGPWALDNLASRAGGPAAASHACVRH